MSLIITIGDLEVRACLPMWPDRFRLHSAVQQIVTQEPVDVQAFSAATHAALGMCWRGDPLDCPSLRACRHDIVAYGDAVFDALYRAGHTDIDGLASEGLRLMRAINDTLITEEEVEAAADPTEAQEGPSIEST